MLWGEWPGESGCESQACKERMPAAPLQIGCRRKCQRQWRNQMRLNAMLWGEWPGESGCESQACKERMPAAPLQIGHRRKRQRQRRNQTRLNAMLWGEWPGESGCESQACKERMPAAPLQIGHRRKRQPWAGRRSAGMSATADAPAPHAAPLAGLTRVLALKDKATRRRGPHSKGTGWHTN
jgi:hypothetical protein